MRLNSMIKYVVSIVILAVSVSHGQQAVIDEVIDDIPSFKTRAIKKWQEMFNQASCYECTMVSRLIEGNKIVSEDKYEVGVMFPFLYIERNEEQHTSFSVECHNNKYGFTLGKDDILSNWKINNVVKYERPIDPKKEWIMKPATSIFVEERKIVEHYNDDERQRGVDFMVRLSSVWGQLCGTNLLPCLFSDPDFHITTISKIINEDGVPCFRLEFTFKSGGEHNLFNIREGTIDLDCSNYAVRHAYYNWGRTDYNFKDVTLMYSSTNNTGFPLVSKIILHDIENGNLRHIEEIEYDYRPVTNLTEDRFKLSYYGFPEPIFEDDAKFDVRWYFLIGGCFFIALAVLITRRRRSEPERQDADDVLAG